MDRERRTASGHIRVSNSPRRFTQVTASPQSPSKSLYPEHEESRGNMESIYSKSTNFSRRNMQSIYSQSDIGHRTADFFEVDSSDDETGLVSGEAVTEPTFDSRKTERPSSPEKRRQPLHSAQPLVSQCEPALKRVTRQLEPESPHSEVYHRLDSNLHEQVPHVNRGSTISTAFTGSVEEMEMPQTLSQMSPQFPQPARMPSNNTHRSSRRWASDPEFVSRVSSESLKSDSSLDRRNPKLDQRLGAHQIAYDFLLHGLLNDEEVMKREQPLESLVTRLSGMRNTMLSPGLLPGLQPFDPRSPRDNLFQQGSLDKMDQIQVKGSESKKVHVVPPAIDTAATRRSFPAHPVRTPYPRTIRKDWVSRPGDQGTLSSTTDASPSASETVIKVSIRPNSRSSRTRTTTITIPTSNEFTAVRSTTEHHPPDSFDDMELFVHLRQAYNSLLPTAWRLLSAQKISRIETHTAHGTNEKGENEDRDATDKVEVLSHFERPSRGRGKYAFVQRAKRSSDPPNIEIVLALSTLRILAFLLAVILLAVVAALLWIFLGETTPPSATAPAQGGFKDAGDRVTSGAVLGICVLLVGLSVQAGWLGVSWAGL